MGIRRFFVTAALAALAGALLVAPSAASAVEASDAAKQECAPLLEKAKKKHGKKRRKAMARYRDCLERYDEEHPPGGGETAGPGAGGDSGGSGGTATDPKAAAQALIEGHQFYRVSYNANTGYSTEELIRTCSGGTYFRRYTSSGATVSEYHDSGSWNITDAKAGQVGGIQGYQATVAVNGTYDGQPASGNAIFYVSGQTQQSAIDLGGGPVEYNRTATSASC